jgi:hypothetical protein
LTAAFAKFDELALPPLVICPGVALGFYLVAVLLPFEFPLIGLEKKFCFWT